MLMITFSDKESVSSLIQEIKPLLEEHYKEIARHQNIIKLNPDFGKYKWMEEKGMIHLVTVRDHPGKLGLYANLIGYFLCFLNQHIHYQDHQMAMNDIIYLSPEYRKGTTAKEMIEYTTQGLKKRGVTKLCINVKLEHDFGSLLKRMGFTPFETVYEKLLVEG